MTDSDDVCTVSDSEDNDDEARNLPSREECESRCQMFAEVTGTDSALAMFYLQDRGWDLQRAISDYFSDRDGAGSATASTGSTKIQPEGQAQRAAKKDNSKISNKMAAVPGATSGASADADSLTLGPTVLQPQQEGLVRVLSWNIDGLDPDNLQSRTEGACALLLQEQPEVIFLQEVVQRSLSVIKASMEEKYTVVTGDVDMVNTPGAYFTTLLLRKDSGDLEKVRVMDYPGSLMTRDLMEVHCQVKGIPLVFLTSHLESTAEYSEERRRQLTMAFDQMLASPAHRTVIFGGDLNLRDKELKGTSAKPPNVYDLWECTGKRPEAKFTWDLMINDNKQLGTKFQPRCRFDRLYIRHCQGHSLATVGGTKVKGQAQPISSYFTADGNKGHKSGHSHAEEKSRETVASKPGLKPVYFELVGIQRLSSCRRFPSDHWGILAHLQIVGSAGDSSGDVSKV